MASTRITVRDIPEELIEQLDNVWVKEGYSSRSHLIVDVLKKYVTLKDKTYVDALTPVLKTMMEDEIRKLSEMSRQSIQTVEAVSLKLLKTSQKLDLYFGEDFWSGESK